MTINEMIKEVGLENLDKPLYISNDAVSDYPYEVSVFIVAPDAIHVS